MTQTGGYQWSGKRRIAIIDPCYHKKGGHHHGVNQELVKNLSWLTPRVYVDSKIDISEIASDYPDSDSIQPVFENIGYIDSSHYSTVNGFCQQAKSVYQQLKQVRAEILIAHTLIHFQLYGLGLYLEHNQSMQVIVSLMFSPFEGLRGEPTEHIDFSLTSIALRSLNDSALRRGHKITVGITSEYHWELLAKLRDSYRFLNFKRSSWLVGAHNRSKNQHVSVKQIKQNTGSIRTQVLLYLGDAKPDKGIERVKDVLKWILERPTAELEKAARGIQLELHITHCDEWLKPCVEEIRELCARMPMLTRFTNTHHSSDEYFDIIASANKLVWLYDPHHYKHRTSGIFYDAVSLYNLFDFRHRAPEFIVSQGSWMQKEFELLGHSPTTIDLSKHAWINDLWEKLTGDSAINGEVSDPNRDLISMYTGCSWSSWVLSELGLNEEKTMSQLQETSPNSRPLIVISTVYPHFTELSGPTGFVKYLEHPLHFKTCLGKSHEYDWIRDLTGLKSSTDAALRLERKLIEVLKTRPADIICIDGEHAGSLLGLALRDKQLHPDTRIFSWFHQPSNILSNDIIDAGSYAAKQIYPICISPCQVSFFHDVLELETDKISVIPHGVHQELISIGERGLRSRANRLADRSNKPLRLLTVGNWLRDHELILHAAESCPEHEFVWVSTGMRLDSQAMTQASSLQNLRIITSGLTNSQLHQEYISSDFLFQPLIAATANNAIIEAMAFGLPVITKSLPSTVFYTDNQAIYYSDAAQAISLLKSLSNTACNTTVIQSEAHMRHVQSLDWRNISNQFCLVLVS